jgi:hypothetical protein
MMKMIASAALKKQPYSEKTGFVGDTHLSGMKYAPFLLTVLGIMTRTSLTGIVKK